MDIRRFGPHYRSPTLHARSAPRRCTRPTTTSATPATSARRAGRCASRARTRGTEPRRRVRREVGLGARQLVRVQRRPPATSRCARAAGQGCTGRRRSAPSTAPRARRPACSTSPRSPSSRSPARGAARAARAAVRQPRRARRRRDHLHPDAQPPRAGSSAISPSRASARSASRSSPGPRSATTTPAGSAATCPATARCADRRDLALGVLRAVGAQARPTCSRR